VVPRQSPFPTTLGPDERVALEAMARKYTSPYRDVVRAKIVLLAATGLANDVIASRLNLPRQIVSKWRKRFFYDRLAGLEEAPRGGRPAAFPPASTSTLSDWPRTAQSFRCAAGAVHYFLYSVPKYSRAASSPRSAASRSGVG